MQILKRRSDAIYLTEMDAFIARRITVDTLGEFYQRVEAVVKTMPEGSLILTDFIGGTTSNVAARLSADYPVAVISGLNASLLLEALDKREHGRLTTCVAELVDAGRSSCLDVVAHVRQLQQSQ